MSTPKPGDYVRLNVYWLAGDKLWPMEGELLTIEAGEAYVMTKTGAVVGPAGTLELCKRPEDE